MGSAAMFSYRSFDVDIIRFVDIGHLRWPTPGEADDDNGLGGNRVYADFRRMPWSEARRVYDLESVFMARLEAAEDPEGEYAAIEDELDEEDIGLYGLDIGVASSVIALSAARCIPFASCNAGALGGFHRERYPLVAFFARNEMIQLLMGCSEIAAAGLKSDEHGSLIVYADDLRSLRRFAEALINKRTAFRSLHILKPAQLTATTQLKLSL